MFRPSKNPKEQTPDETADHTRRPANTPISSPSSSGSSGSGSSASAAPPSSGGTPPARAVTESESLARDIKEGTLTGFVGNGTALTGEASFKGMLRVDGHLSGRVSSDDGTLIVSTNGQVDANVEVAVAQIYGTVNGDIVASKRIEMGRVAKVTGNIQTPALVIESGALFEGSCRMTQARDSSDKQTKKETATPSVTTPTPSTTPTPTPAPSAGSSSTAPSTSSTATSAGSGSGSSAAGSTAGSTASKSPGS